MPCSTCAISNQSGRYACKNMHASQKELTFECLSAQKEHLLELGLDFAGWRAFREAPPAWISKFC
jgi:hypothetical protein